ncbi:MAG: ribosome silencing factor [Magnetovibrionaceae bacterium]
MQGSLDDDKASDVVVIDLTGKSTLADHMIIATGQSQRHVGAMADHLRDSIKSAGFGSAQVEGLTTCDWVLVDAGDIIVHLFRPEVRAFYQLEKMWESEPDRVSVGGMSPAVMATADAGSAGTALR